MIPLCEKNRPYLKKNHAHYDGVVLAFSPKIEWDITLFEIGIFVISKIEYGIFIFPKMG